MSTQAQPPVTGGATLPLWARAADGLALVLVAVAALVAATGGFRILVAGIRLSVTSAPRVLLAALAVLVVRQAIRRDHPAYQRLWDALRRYWTADEIPGAGGRTSVAVRRRRLAVLPLYGVVVVAFLLSLGQYRDPLTGFTSLICFGQQFEQSNLPAVASAPHYIHRDSPGYDGQFYAQLAMEPLLRDRRLDHALDTPPYRARRILFSWTAYVLGLGEPARILNAYALQNIISWLLLAFLLLRWFPPTRARHVLPWVGCLFGVGTATSFRFALLEGPSMVIIVLAVLAVERDRPWLAAGLLGLGGLARETNVLASGALARDLPRDWTGRLRLAARLVLVALPFVLWAAYVKSVYPAFSFSNPDSFSLPFSGYLAKWTEVVTDLRTAGWHSYARFNIGLMIGVTTQIGYLAWRRDWSSPWWRAGAAYCLLTPLLSFPVWEGYPGAAPRVLLPVAFAFNAQIVKDRWFWPLVIVGNLSVWHGIPMIGVPWLSPLL